MESLKKLEEVFEPDTRQKNFARMDTGSAGGFRSLTLKDYHDAATRAELHKGVPQSIQDEFQTARNLVLYSWFYYPFNMAAQLSAYATAEHALRIKANRITEKPSFVSLIREAISNKWIQDEGFSHIRQKHESFKTYNENLPPEYRRPQEPLAQEYCKAIEDALPFLRNDLAHGTNSLHGGGATTLRICADLINQLFEKPSANRNTLPD